MRKIILPKNVEFILNFLNDEGFEAFVVGGFVRDYIIGMQITDIDISTSAKPVEVCSIFSDFTVIETGIKHGTVTVLIEKTPYEITTFRVDGDYLDSRKPETVEFISDIKSDLLRRDFTINSLAYSCKSGILDYYGGILDIKNKIIRCVGEPETRFKEDALRILRAIRFSSTLDFNIEPNTQNAMKQQAFRIKNISCERVTSELIKTLISDNPEKGINLILKTCKDEVFPELEFNSDINSLNNSKKSLSIRLSKLLLTTVNIRSLAAVNNFFNRLKFDNYTKFKVLKILNLINVYFPPNEIAIKYFLKDYGLDIIKEVTQVREDINSEEILKVIDIIEKRKDCYSLKALDINGSDLIEIGFKENKKIGEVLERLLNLVIEAKIENKKENLIKTALLNIE